MRKINISLIIIIFCISFCSCQSDRKQKTVGDNESIKFQQYMVQGQLLFAQHCSNCHAADGKGLANLYPPLAGSDFLTDNIAGTICAIKTGLNGEIVVNGVSYNFKMPANPKLTNIDIAEISTYIYNSWGNETGIIPVKKVEELVQNCPAEN